MRAIAGLLVILALVPIASSQNGTVCYGKMAFSKTACLTSSQSVNIVGQARPPTAVLMEIMGSGLPAVPLISGYTSQSIGFTSVVANKQTTTGQYWAEYLLVQDTLINNAQSTLRTNKFQYGSITVTNFETIEQCVQVTFLTTMAGTPDVKLSPHTTASEELIYLWLKDVTATGFKVCYHEGILFSGIHAFNVHYVAIAEQGQIESQRDIQDEHMKVRMLAGSQAATGTPKFCQRVAFRLTYRSNPFVYCTPEQDSNPKCGGEFISWVHAIDTLGATVCARNSEDLSSGLRKQNVSLNCLVFGGRMDIVPGMVQLAAVPNTCDVFCRDVTFPANKFWTGLPMHVQLTVTWQKTPVIPNGHHEASAVWAESLTHSGFKACTLVAGRHFSINDNYPIPAVNWLAYQLPASQCVTPPLIGGSCALPDWYTGARCCSVTVGKVIALTSKILVSARHTKTQTFIDAMTTWSELSECNGTTVVRLCARELQNFDGLHQGIHLHWLLVENALPPFIPEQGDIGFPRQFYGLGNTMPAVCKDVTFAQNYDNLPIATVILSPKNCSKGCEVCTGFSNNDFVSWIETRTNTNMRVCMKSLRACLYREEVKVPYIVVTEPRCAGKTTGFYLKDTFCHDYFQCNDGAYSDGSCGANQYFNLQTGACQATVPTGCQDPRCINQVNGFYLINTVCRSYYQCSNGFYTGLSCSGTQYFNLQLGACQNTVPQGCQDPRCNNIANGFYLINNLCKSYYQCQNGFYTGYNCQANEYYNLQTGVCQAQVAPGCQNPICIGQTNGFYLVNNRCNNYYQCADGIYTLNACANNQYFNIQTSQCQASVPNGCQDPRCIGFNDGFYLVNNVCRNYYQCNGGFYTGFSCANNQYFNIQTGACQATVPTGCQDPRCAGQTNGFYLINNLCKQYYKCQDGFYTGGSCAGTNGQDYFNLVTGTCQGTLPSGCQDPRCVAKANGLYLVNNFCKDYFRCQDGFYTALNCATGYFNSATGVCETAVPSGCRDPRCTGVTNGFYLVNTVCTSYYECKDGFYSSFACNNGYFNLKTSQCQTAVPDGCQDPRCIGQTNGLYLVNNLCKDYYRCTDGFYSGLKCASTSQYFNKQTGVCQDAVPTGCQDPRCTGRADGLYLVNNLCSAYFKCTGGIYEGFTCGNGQYFNTGSGQCQTALPSGCQDPRCIGRATGFYLVNNLCTAYFKCDEGFYTGFSCPNGYYNIVDKKCQTTVPNGCQDPRCIGKTNGHYLVNNLCTSYFYCNDGVYTAKQCASNNYFDLASQKCQSAVPTGCQDPRCHGKADGFYLVNNLCMNYFRCEGGIYNLLTCTTGTYFNRATGKCQSAVPQNCQDPRCIGQSAGFYLVNNVCTAYYKCDGNGLYTGFSCPNGYYNIKDNKCQTAVPTGCQDPRCIGKTNGHYLVNNLCTSYFHCNDGVYTAKQCASKNYFDLASQKCQPAVPTGCQDPHCHGKADGFYLVNNLCMNYFRCEGGIYNLLTCTTGTYFNRVTGKCQSVVPQNCQDPRCIGQSADFYLVNNLCTSYFKCDGNGLYTGFTCLNGYYNLAEKKCQTAVPSGCQDPRCAGRANGFYLVNNLCTAYFQCQDGFHTSFSCPAGQYYDISQSTCQANVPNGCQDPRCTSKANGFYLVNNLCTNYFQCTDGIYKGLACQNGQYFNRANGQCQTTIPTGCQDPRCIGRATDFYLVNNLCTHYFKCEDGFYTGQTCPGGYYNIAEKKCQTTVPSGCQDPRCAGRTNGVYLVNNLCTSYFRCQDGFYTGSNCQNGQYFNTVTGICQTTLPTGCQDPRCSGRADGLYLLNNLCTSYYRCASGFYTSLACQAGQYFNTANGQCQTQLPSGCQDPRCIGRQDGAWVFNTLCTQYFTCTSSVYALLSCQAGQYFNQVTGQCQSQLPSGCQDPRCSGLSNGNFKITTDNLCRTYFTCTNGQYTTNTCPTGQYFHVGTGGNIGTCQNTLPAGCADPRCIGITDGVYRLNNLCTAYYRCQGGVYTLSNCANGQYFNQVTGVCQVNVPAGCQDPRCIGRTDNFYLVNNLCTAYFSCTSGVYAGFQCNPGNYYNLVTKQCQNTIPSGCQDPICIGRTDGFYVSNNLCVSYFQCAAGISTTRSCQAGNYFNVATGQCQATTPSGCQDSFCQTRTNGNYPVDTLCRSYYNCQNGFKTINTCANNGYYNSLTRVCQTGVPNGCQHPDCRDANGLKTGNFVIDVTCVGYYSCSNGLKTVAQCQTGLYFNVQTGACQASVPAGCSNPLCQGKTDGNYLTNNLCTSYYNCASGVYTLRTCTTGYFNLQTGQCQNQVPNGCQNPLCVGRTDGLYLSNNLCTTYFSCISGIANILACPQGQYFNSAATNNNVNNQSPCQTQLPSNCQDPLCTSRADGYYITDGTACQNYYRCASGFRTVGTCAANTFINSVTGQCQNTRPAGCAPASVCSNLANGNYKQLTDQYCRTYYTCTSNVQSGIQTCPNNTPYFVAVSNSLGSCQVNRPANCLQNLCFGQVNAFYVTNNFCTSYFQCTNQQVPQIATCANGQYFNTAINQCTNNVPATCVNPLCQNGNLLRTENIATDATCTGGYRCNNGILSSQQNCGTQYYNVQTGNCETNRPAQCQARTVNLCATATNGFYHADGQICKSYYQCINNQVPQIQTCVNQLQPFFNTQTGQCQTLLPANQNCLDPRCYQINNNQIVLKTGGEVTDAPTCTSGFVCTNGVISNVATCQNTAQGQRTYYQTSNGQCTTAVPAGCTAPVTPAPGNADCTGKADNDRVPDPTDPTKFYVCQNQQPTTSMQCPTAVIFPMQAPNGKYFSPYFKTCINTTTGNPPVHVPTGTSDMCQEIATYVAFGFSGTRLPDVTNCKKWVQCTDQQFIQASIGSCVSQQYDPDKQFCDFNHKCFFPNP